MAPLLYHMSPYSTDTVPHRDIHASSLVSVPPQHHRQQSPPQTRSQGRRPETRTRRPSFSQLGSKPRPHLAEAEALLRIAPQVSMHHIHSASLPDPPVHYLVHVAARWLIPLPRAQRSLPSSPSLPHWWGCVSAAPHHAAPPPLKLALHALRSAWEAGVRLAAALDLPWVDLPGFKHGPFATRPDPAVQRAMHGQCPSRVAPARAPTS